MNSEHERFPMVGCIVVEPDLSGWWESITTFLRVAGCVVFVLFSSAIVCRAQPWQDTSLAPEERAALLVAAMTLDEKIAMVHGSNHPPYVGAITNNSRLGIPALRLQDGPAGVGDGLQGVTALPAPALLAATWDTALARQYGEILGTEAKGKGVDVILGPMVNIARVPQSGRAFEMLGEDPFLASKLVADLVPGIQSQGVIANAKHFVGNEQETTRGNSNSQIDERTLHEIYLPPFRAAVCAGVGSIMTAYNRVNHPWSGQTPLLGAVVKGMWNFAGFMVCDWGANFDVVPAAQNGLDLEMPQDVHFGAPLKSAIQNGDLPESQLDEMVQRITATMFRFGIFDNPTTDAPNAVVTTPAHAQFAFDAASQGMVLLTNSSGLLPLNPASVHSIAVIGSIAGNDSIWVGGGSAQVYLPYYDVPVNAISNRATNITVTYSPGDGASITQAVQLAQQSDVAIVCVGELTGEGTDRTSLSLPTNQDALVTSIAQANPNTIVVMYVSGATLMPWIGQVRSAIVAWYPGQENGRPLAAILFGDVNPSGKLPVTFPVASNEVPANTIAQFPGTNLEVSYSERLLVGYRWYDSSNVAPRFPFGHGLSYTTFSYSNLSVSSVSPSGQVTVELDLRNTGSRSGAEVVQLYLGLPPAAGEPPRQLKGFQKVLLAPGELRHLKFNLLWEDLACWDVAAHAWKVPVGSAEVFVGSSSRDIRLTGTLDLSQPIPSSSVGNHALYRKTSVSSMVGNGFEGARATDGDFTTQWKAVSGAQWITIDLGAPKDLARVRLTWSLSFGRAYQIRTSNDQTNWTVCFGTTNGTGAVEDIVLSGNGRYVQLNATQSAGPGGYGLREFQVFPPEIQIVPRLTVQKSSSTTTLLSWPTNWAGSFLHQNTFLNWSNYTLQQSVAPASNWTTVSVPRTVSGSNVLVTLPLNNGQFFRLVSPN